MVTPYIELAMEGTLRVGKGFQGKVEIQRTKHLQNSNIFFIIKVTTIYFMPFLLYTRLKNPIGILTKNNKITIACFKPTISVGFDPYSRKVLLGRLSALAG